MLTKPISIAFVLALGSGGAAAAPCLPSVIVDGDPAVAAPIAEALARRGLSTPAPACPSEQARVTAVDNGILVTIVDADGRRAERLVTDAATAAVLIESFAMPLLDQPTLAEPPREPAMPVVAMTDREQPLPAPAQLVITRPGGRLGAGFESSFASDGSVWFGVNAGACFRLGRACIGAELRFAHDGQLGGDARRTGSTRDATDLLVNVAVPITRGRWTFSPGAGVGVGWLRSMRSDVAVTDTIEVDTGGLRADVQLAAGFRVTRSLSLRLSASLGLAPDAHVAPYSEEGMSLAGEPRAFGRVQAGVELGR